LGKWGKSGDWGGGRWLARGLIELLNVKKKKRIIIGKEKKDLGGTIKV